MRIHFIWNWDIIGFNHIIIMLDTCTNLLKFHQNTDLVSHIYPPLISNDITVSSSKIHKNLTDFCLSFFQLLKLSIDEFYLFLQLLVFCSQFSDFLLMYYFYFSNYFFFEGFKLRQREKGLLNLTQ